MLVCRRSARAARTAAQVSGSSTSRAMAMPITVRGAPAAAIARSIVGESTLASPTTATSETRSRPKLAQACAFASYCGAGHFEEHYQTFIASPFVYQQAQRYRALIHAALRSQDWAQIGLGPKLTTATRVASR